MAWMFLLAAGLLEIVWAYRMKRSQGFTRPAPTAVTIFDVGEFRAAIALWTGGPERHEADGLCLGVRDGIDG